MSTRLATTPRSGSHLAARSGGRHRPSIAQRNARVERHRQLVRPIARHYQSCSPEPLEDLEQVGLLGLLRAAELYHSSRQTPFEAFARPHIRGAILHYLRDQSRPVRLPRRQMELEDRVRQLRRQLPAGGEGPEALTAWCQRLGVSPGQWQRFLLAQQLSRPLSFDQIQIDDHPATVDPGDGGVRGELIPSLAELEPRQRQAVQLVVLTGMSLRGAAARLGSSPSTVQRDLRKGLAELRQRCEGVSQRLNPVASAAPAC